jgi:hypothetical protein
MGGKQKQQTGTDNNNNKSTTQLTHRRDQADRLAGFDQRVVHIQCVFGGDEQLVP